MNLDGNEEELKSMVYNYGPVVVVSLFFFANFTCFNFYQFFQRFFTPQMNSHNTKVEFFQTKIALRQISTMLLSSLAMEAIQTMAIFGESYEHFQ